MTTRALVVSVVVLALAVPAASLAAGGNGKGKAPGSTVTRVARNGAVLQVRSRLLAARYRAFSKHCLVANAPPERCAKAADRIVRRLDRLATWIRNAEAKIKETCGAASPPARCAKAPTATARLDALLAKIASRTAEIKAAFPGAGGSSG